MTSGRADPMADMDLSDFEAKPAARPRIPVAAIREASEQQNFPSRAPTHSPSPPRREQRRHRTGRSHQLNLKVTADAADRFGKLADAQGWVLGEAFEKALAALEEKFPAKG